MNDASPLPGRIIRRGDAVNVIPDGGRYRFGALLFDMSREICAFRIRQTMASSRWPPDASPLCGIYYSAPIRKLLVTGHQQRLTTIIVDIAIIRRCARAA